MTYPEAIQFLYDLQMFGAKFGLENTFKLAQFSGNPQEKLRFIHVAGTNGKGSTCAILESIYRAAGLRVGLFTSPHLVSFAERIQVNRQLIAETEVVRQVSEMREILKTFPQDTHPTFFEVVTVMALKYFAEQRCDLVIWETGMGGRLDSTNMVTPLASVITNVQLDHQKWLGDTIEAIAFEKAGIIKAGVPVITAEGKQEALQVIRNKATENSASLKVVQADDANSQLLAKVRFPLLGDHQKLNAALALATIAGLQNQIQVSPEAICTGLETVSWPARLQLLTTPSRHKILLDGAHNVAGAEMLRRTLVQTFASEKITIILGMLRDKQFAEMCRMLAPLAQTIYLVPVGSERTVSPEELKLLCTEANPKAVVHACRTLKDGLEMSRTDSFVLITGSLYLMGEAMELLGVSPARSERGLNEWSTDKK